MHDSQSRETLKYGHEYRWTRSQSDCAVEVQQQFTRLTDPSWQRVAQLSGWDVCGRSHIQKDKIRSVVRNISQYILWRVYPLLGNISVNIFPWKQTHATIGRPFAGQRISKHALKIEAVLSAWSVQSGYKEVFGRGQIPPPWPCES
jgi:hypothetical protein